MIICVFVSMGFVDRYKGGRLVMLMLLIGHLAVFVLIFFSFLKMEISRLQSSHRFPWELQLELAVIVSLLSSFMCYSDSTFIILFFDDHIQRDISCVIFESSWAV